LCGSAFYASRIGGTPCCVTRNIAFSVDASKKDGAAAILS
jgi:hypothetical protein